MKLTLPKWYDLHVHLRQGPALRSYVEAHLSMGCAGVLAMPNTTPPVTQVCGAGTAQSWSIEGYLADLRSAGGSAFDDIIVPLYLTRNTTSQTIKEGVRSGLLRACKYYPPHGTTNAEHGMAMEEYLGGDVFRAMEDCGVVLNIHGEDHKLGGADFIDSSRNAESLFYQEMMPRLIDAHPNLRVVCEHLTTKEAVAFVESAPDHIAATITPQHLLFTLGDLIQGLKFHLFCLPVVKFEEDRQALREALRDSHQRKFFAGSDSAPHPTKISGMGGAAGCFTGGCAPQLYTMAFEEAGIDLATGPGYEALRAFLCENGPRYYGIPVSKERFTLVRSSNQVSPLRTSEGPVVPLPLGVGKKLTWDFSQPAVEEA